MKITLEVNTRQPNIELFEHYTVGQAHGAKKLRFREFEEANVGAIENDSGGIDIAPAYALFDGVFQHGCRVSGPRFQVASFKSRSQLSSLKSGSWYPTPDTRHPAPDTPPHPKNFVTVALNSSGFSRFTTCPAPLMISRHDPGISRCMSSASAGGVITSSLPTRIKVGTVICDKKEV